LATKIPSRLIYPKGDIIADQQQNLRKNVDNKYISD